MEDYPVLITPEEARRIIEDAIPIATSTESVPVHQTIGRYLAEYVRSERNVPERDNSAMDGFVFLKEDVNSGKRTFGINGEIRPEDKNPESLKTGECKRIMTGASVPSGDVLVVPVELTESVDSKVNILQIPEVNPIRKKGEGYKKGSVVLEKGTHIRPFELGILIDSGNTAISVFKKISVAVQITGNEISEESDTNGPVLEALINTWPSVDVDRKPVLPDTYELVLSKMQELSESHDIVVTTGGISMGEYDYILKAMKELGAEILLRKVRQKPGKPFTVSRLNNTLFFHLPGNPVSAVFTAGYYVKEAILLYFGQKSSSKKAIACEELFNLKGDRTLFAPARLYTDESGRQMVTGQATMKSHLMQLYKGNNAYMKIDPQSSIPAGGLVKVVEF